ncbi:hypothetical protein AA101099_0513 [Neoasaia chiangmaiensis NBRC 101099]|uniref:Uncharacterized protein n=1 Tax=Neoasaia chiangmaiensis TaxID=320497 RepID=A0A1U9KTK8_9PROT|nr:hypothetical protein [Neoasaia chiangmaiensis]AQS89069.1 hypothetical protein A0U93_15385 [Neoasaia chiangmaiensis]GBR36915.1 hypothetical protein AA101099_0513 [Neoasaia chiangmaiensis NBRC 101099]GEN16597.1 hypothetical protein NCH01_30280 [Neoasaia chiangmaiensis]
MTPISPPTGIAMPYALLRVLVLHRGGFFTLVVPDIPEAIWHVILRVEMALDAALGRGTAGGVS